MVDVISVALLIASGQALAWAFLPTFDRIEKIGAGIMASHTVPALTMAILNFEGILFSPWLANGVYAMFVVISVAQIHRTRQKNQN